MSSEVVIGEFETVWSINEAFRAIQEVREQDLTPDPKDQEYFINNIGCFTAAQEVIVELIRNDVPEIDEHLLMASAYDALAESERGEDVETIALRTLYKLDEIQTEVAGIVDAQENNIDKDTVGERTNDQDVFERLRGGDNSAATEIIEQYGRFAKKMAWKFARRISHRASAVDYDDLEQESMIALLKAAENYNRDGSASFLTYAAYGIFRTLQRHIDDMASTVRIPTHIRQKIRKVEGLNWHRRHGKRPLLSTEEIAEICQVYPSEYVDRSFRSTTVGTLRHAVLISDNMGSIDTGFSPRNDVSPGNDYILDERKGLESITATESKSVEEEASIATLPQLVQEALRALDERERLVLTLRFGLGGTEGPKTLQEVGAAFNLTRERIREIEARALSKLRHPLKADLLRGF